MTVDFSGGPVPPDLLVIVTQPAHGTAVVSGVALVYTAATDYSGPDTFTYQATWDAIASNIGTATVTVLPPLYGCEQPLLEVWPPPNDTYTLRLRGYPVVKDFGVPDPTTGLYNDADVTACDARLVFLMALSTAKAHYGRQDASVTANELTSLLGTLRAGRHGNLRYVPGKDDIDPRKMYVAPIWTR